MNIKKNLLFLAVIVLSNVYAVIPEVDEIQNNSLNQEYENPRVQKAHQTLGHFLCVDLASIYSEIDINEVVKGMEDCIAGKEPPMSDKEVDDIIKGPKQNKRDCDLKKAYQTIGHFICKEFNSYEFDMYQVIKGMKGFTTGKKSPMNEKDCADTLLEVFEQVTSKNLEETNSFMARNANKEGIVSLQKNKLQYKIKKHGSGTTVEKCSSPIIRYSGNFLHGKTAGTFQNEVLIPINEAITGFSQGVTGMKEGEKRTIYIHPELGFGKKGNIPPNSLLIFEVEVIKVNPTKEEIDSFSSTLKDSNQGISIKNPLCSCEPIVN